MFINFTNHPSTVWSEEQLATAKLYGEIIDESFPIVEPEASEVEITKLADEKCKILKKLLADGNANNSVVHVMGEMTLTFAVVSRLKDKGITCVASTTKREVTTLPDGSKVSTFQFVRFRKY